MICKKCKTENQEGAKFCSNCGSRLDEEIKEKDVQEISETEAAEESATEEVEIKDLVEKIEGDATIWYYVVNGKSKGPFSEAQIKELVENGTIGPVTYVWKSGTEDWILFMESELAHLQKLKPASQNSSEEQKEAAPYYSDYRSKTSVEERSIVLNVILSVVTLGIYRLVWLYFLARDVNRLLMARGRSQIADPLLVVILSILTFGLYRSYFFYKAGKAMYAIDLDDDASDNSALFTITSFFSYTVALAILQNEVNTYVRYTK